MSVCAICGKPCRELNETCFACDPTLREEMPRTEFQHDTRGGRRVEHKRIEQEPNGNAVRVWEDSEI